MASQWTSFDECSGGTKQWRYLDDGRIEVAGEGPIIGEWPGGVNSHEADIMSAALKYEIPPHWIAAIMALETGGKSVCLRRADGSCDSREGAGVMATLPSTASSMLGRPVSSAELVADPSVAIDAGSAYLRHQLDRYDGDFVKAAIAYNAGSVKCGLGSTFIPSDKKDVWQKEPCPDTGWGVVMGCVYANKLYDPNRCSPSLSAGVPPYKCSGDYPRAAIRINNAAILDSPFGAGEPPPDVIDLGTGETSMAQGLVLAAAFATAGFFATKWALSR